MSEPVGTRRRLAAIVPEDDVKVGRRMGRPVLFGYGYRYLGRLGRSCRQALSAARKRGVPLHEPPMAISWALARRGKRELAGAILKEFGYASRFKVSRRTIKPIDN